MPERVLITGATGFVGSAVARAFCEAGYRVRVLVRESSPQTNLAGLAVEAVFGDLTRAESFTPALAGCQGLVHVAADYRFFVPDPKRMYQVNVTGTERLFREAARAGVRRMVYTSSVATLGHRRDDAPADETNIAGEKDMIGHYKRSKLIAEDRVRRLAVGEDLDIVIVNPSAPVGPRDIKPTPTGRMVYEAARGHMPAYVDTGLNIVHVDDVGHGHRLAYERGQRGERYILGGDNLTLARILAIIARFSARRAPRIRLAPAVVVPVAWLAEGWARMTHTQPFVTRDELAMARRPMYFTSAKAERELGYTHRPADLAFEDALTWAAAQGRLGRNFRLHCPPSQRGPAA